MNDKTLPTPADNGRSSQVQVREAGAGGMLLPSTLTDVITFAKVMAGADIALPKFLRGNEGACLAVAMQAFRWEMDPFAVANKAYYVNDRVAYEAQLVAAVIHTRAPIVGRPSYEYLGEGPTRQCRVTCTMLDGEVREYLSPMERDIKVKNSPLWKADLDQQLGYYSIRSWGRRHAPEVILGVYVPEEVEQMRDVTPQKTGLAAKLEAGRVQETGGFSPRNIDAALEAEFEEVTTTETEAQEDAPETPPEEPVSHVAWVEGFRAEVMKRGKNAGLSMEVWRENFDRIQVIQKEDIPLFDRLETWFGARLKKLREAEQNAALDHTDQSD